MTYSAENFSPAFKFGIVTGLCMAATAVLVRIVHEYRTRKTARVLAGLDDTALRDIGLDRDRIFQAACHAATAAAQHRSR
jgi:uncharacterized protein YjiS (DUF1127 family)